MSWAAGRTTTRPEDEAYCLLGIFGINMPLIYGEGRNAFRRLQEEIIKRSNDLSIFAFEHDEQHPSLLLAGTPSQFKQQSSRRSRNGPSVEFAITNRGLNLIGATLVLFGHGESIRSYGIGIDDFSRQVLPLKKIGASTFIRHPKYPGISYLEKGRWRLEQSSKIYVMLDQVSGYDVDTLRLCIPEMTSYDCTPTNLTDMENRSVILGSIYNKQIADRVIAMKLVVWGYNLLLFYIEIAFPVIGHLKFRFLLVDYDQTLYDYFFDESRRETSVTRSGLWARARACAPVNSHSIEEQFASYLGGATVGFSRDLRGSFALNHDFELGSGNWRVSHHSETNSEDMVIALRLQIDKVQATAW